jgi:hypothetical protein
LLGIKAALCDSGWGKFLLGAGCALLLQGNLVMPSNSWEEFDADFRAGWESAFESACGAALAVKMSAVRHDLNGPSLGDDGRGVKVTIELQSSSLKPHSLS